MKVILTGVTGFIGSEVLAHCQEDQTITSIILLARQPIPETILKDPKVEAVVIEDFNVYSEEVIKKMEGAAACIWSMGTTGARADIETEYPLTFCSALAPTIARQQKPFRYLYCSGQEAEIDKRKCLLFRQTGRRTKGMAELEMMDFEDDPIHGGHWQTFIMKPSTVLPKKRDKGGLGCLASAFIDSVRVDEFAAAMLDIVKNGSEEQVLHNEDIVMRGRAALDRHKLCPVYNCNFM